MERIHPDGFFVAPVRRPARAGSPIGCGWKTARDIRGILSIPISFGPVLTDFDLHLARRRDALSQL